MARDHPSNIGGDTIFAPLADIQHAASSNLHQDLPTYIGRPGQHISSFRPLTLEISVDVLSNTINHGRRLLWAIVPSSLRKLVADYNDRQGLALQGKAKDLDKMLAELERRVWGAFSISDDAMDQLSGFERLQDRRIRKDARYEKLHLSTKRNVQRIEERFRDKVYYKLRQTLPETSVFEKFSHVFKKPSAPSDALPFKNLLEDTKIVSDRFIELREKWAEGIGAIRRDVLKGKGMDEAKELQAKVDDLYDKASDLDTEKFYDSFGPLDPVKDDMFASKNGPDRVIKFLETWIDDHQPESVKRHRHRKHAHDK